MRVEQAIFTSVRSRKTQGYHLVAASPGLPDDALRALTRWGPSHASLSLATAEAESFNYHALTDDWQAISRTVYGGPEYSRRGGLQVYTQFLVLRSEQWAAYENNPVLVARTAQLLGHLRFQLLSQEVLPPVELPDRGFTHVLKCTSESAIPLHDILRILQLQDRVALLACSDPIGVVQLLLREMAFHDRLRLSFTTGLKLSVDREFRLLFSPRIDANLSAQLKAQGIDSVLCA